MKKLNMRILAALLALLMFVNSCPTFAIATDTADSNNIPETTQATETPATEAPATEPPATDAAAVTQQNPCDTCGKDDCTGSHTNWCAICKKDACGVTHVLCQICQHYDCGVTHALCEICQNYDCGVTHRFCDICKMYDCIVDGHGETVPADAAEDPTDPAGADGSGEPAAPADNCPWCEDTLGEDGTVIHSELCNAAYAYNGAADMGKYAKLSGDAISYGIDVSANPKTDKTGKQFFDTDFEDNTILRITGWYWDSETTALWYRVGFYSGGAVSAAGWPTSAWILQKYTDPDNDYGVSLSIFSGCSICGAPECEALHTFCENCKIYDCGVDHDAKEPDSVSEDGGSDHSADIGKYLKLNSAVSSFKVYNAENGNTLTYVHDDFTGDAIMRVADWKIDDQGLWYLVEFYKGGIVESSYTVDFPANPWFLQTDGTAANTFLFMQCCATCGLPDCDGNHETETVPSVSHPSGITVSSDSGIPADSAVSMANHSSVGDGSENVYDIKVLNADGTKWQPAPGETVRVSMPVSIEHDGSVTVMHILEDAAQITYALANGKAEVQDLADVDATFQSLLGDAVAAYRAATGSSANAVAYELFEDVPVLNGYVTVDACGFSIFVLGESGYAEVDTAWDELSPFMTYYVKPGDTITFSTTSSEQNKWSLSDPAGIVTAENRKQSTRYYKDFKVAQAAVESQSFTITYQEKTITFVVISATAPEEDPNEQTVAISIYRGEGFPAEPLRDSGGTYWRYTQTGITDDESKDFSTVTSGIIKTDKLLSSSLMVQNNPGLFQAKVSAIVDNSGQRTLEFITLSEELKADLVAKYLAADGNPEDPDLYEFLIYVVKREEFFGTKWYINGKVVKKDKVFVTYERNLPDDYFDDFVLEDKFPKNQDVDRGESVTLSSNVKTPITTTVDGKKVTATWLGWSTDPNATAPEYTGGQTINNLQTDLKLYAVWKITGVEYKISDIEISKWVVFDTSGQPDYADAEEYSFTLTGNGLAGAAYMIHDYSGTQVGESGTITASPFAFTLKNGHTIVISDVPQGTYSVTEAEKEGYKLAPGAARTRTFTFGTGNGEINVGEYLTTYENRKIQYYTITFFDGTDMTTLINPNPRRYEENKEVPLESVSKPGYHFAGWKCEDSTCSDCTGDDPQYHTGSFVMPARNIVLYAQWNPHTYEVRFNGNGATSGSMAAQSFTYGVAQPLNANQFVRAYTVNFNAQGGNVEQNTATATAVFTGWKNGAAAYSDQQSVMNLTTDDGGVYELTAQWNPGSVMLPEPTRDGYTFGGWYSDDGFAAADKIGDASATYTPSQDVTLYAKWTPNTYTVRFDGNGRTSGTMADQSFTYNEEQALRANGFERKHTVTYVVNGGIMAENTETVVVADFIGWKYASADYSDQQTVKNLSAVNGATCTLVAQWQLGSVTLPDPFKTGYTFGGWYSDDGFAAADKIGDASATYTPSQDVTLYAKWTPNTYTVHFDGNGHTSGTTADQSFAYDEEKALQANGFEKVYTVYFDAQGGNVEQSTATATATFTGWKHGDTTYSDGQSVRNLTAVDGATCTLVAQWNPGSVTLPEPTRDGYIFSGWYTDADCTDHAGDAGTVCVPSQNMTLYAKWTAAEYTVDVQFDSDHVSFTGLDGFTPTNSGLQKEVEYGTELNIEVNLKTGYKIDQVLINNVIQQDFDGQINHKVLTNTEIEIKTKPIFYLITWTDDAANTLHTQQVPYGETPVYPGGTPTKAATAQYTYNFTGWSPAVTPVTGPATYQATFDKTVNQYTITFVDEDGTTELYVADFAYGATPEYRGEIPTKAGDAQYSYTFAGWDKKIVPVAGQATYKATYTPTVNKYEVIFVDDDGSVLKEAELYPYGTAADKIQKPADPTKAPTAQYTYEFAGWTPVISDVTGNVTYTATYTAVLNKYEVKFVNYNGDVLQRSDVEYGQKPAYTGEMPAKPGDSRYSYTFSGWTPEFATVTGNVTYTAAYQQILNSYTITYVVGDGAEGQYPTGDTSPVTAAVDSVVTLKTAGWDGTLRQFQGWDEDGDGDVDYAGSAPFTMPDHDVTLTAVWYTQYVVQHFYHNSKGDREGYNGYAPAGSTITLSASNPLNKAGYVCMEGGVVITEKIGTIDPSGKTYIYFDYYPEEYSITYDLDGGVVNVTNPESYCVESEEIVLVNPEKEGYTFMGWTGTDLVIPTMEVKIPKGSTGQREYTATWQINAYKVQFNPIITVTNQDDLAELAVEHGGKVTLPTPVPENAGYQFLGWDTYGYTDVEYQAGAEVEIVEDTVFSAVWVPLPNVVTYEFQGVPAGMAPNIQVDVTYGETYTIQKPAISGYIFTEIVSVKGASGTECQVTDGQFKMIAEAVTVTLAYTQTKLTIAQTGVRASDTVFYQITGTAGNPFSMTVSLSGSGSVDVMGIPLGTYNIEEIGGNWTWSYGNAGSQEANVSTAHTTVTFNHGFSLSCWLSGEVFKNK